jgi:hypothetical protein
MRLFFLTLVLLPMMTCSALAAGPTTVPVDPAQPYKHELTGMLFPPMVGDFVRGQVHAFDAQNHDVAVAYDLQAVRVILTAYAYPAEGRGTVDEEMKNISTAIERRSPNAQRVGEADRKIRQGAREVVAKEVVYEMPPANDYPELRSRAILLRVGANCIKFRVSYAKADADVAEKAIDAFLGALTLPE